MAQQHKLGVHAVHLSLHGWETEAEVWHIGCFLCVLLFGGLAFGLHDKDEVGAVGVEFVEEPFDVPLEGAEDCEGEGGGLEDFLDVDVGGGARVPECIGFLDGAGGETQVSGRGKTWYR